MLSEWGAGRFGLLVLSLGTVGMGKEGRMAGWASLGNCWHSKSFYWDFLWEISSDRHMEGKASFYLDILTHNFPDGKGNNSTSCQAKA